MNILFIGPYRQKDGWGAAAKDYAIALDHTDHNVKISPIYMGITPDANIGERLEEMENRKFDSYDIIIQNVLPHLLEYHGEYKNIGLFYLETHNIDYTLWPRAINNINEVWLSSDHEIKTLTSCNVNVPTHNIPVPVDTSRYDKEYAPIDIPELNDNFVFYFIGEYIQRKNLEALLIAFHREFHTTEPVRLLIKTNKGGVKSYNLLPRLQHDIDMLKNTLRIYRNKALYKNEILITEYIPHNDLMALHQQCDCFVMPSSGEACCRPAIDALGFGSTPIVTQATGMNSIVNKHTGWLVNSYAQPVLTTEPPMEEIYTARETWNVIDTLDLQRCMREAYSISGKKRYSMQQFGKSSTDAFSYTNVAKKMNYVLSS